MPHIPPPFSWERVFVWNLLFASIALLSLDAVSDAAEPTAENQRRVGEVLAGALTLEDLKSYAEGEPVACTDVQPAARVCSWYFNNRKAGWAALAKALGTRYQVTLVCQLPARGGQREPDACRAYPKHHEESSFATDMKTPSPAELSDKPYLKYYDEETLRKMAADRLAGARTLWDLIDLVGIGPSACVSRGETEQTCRWSVTPHQIGHSIIQAYKSGGESRKSLDLQCVIPVDGRDRADDSCEVH